MQKLFFLQIDIATDAAKRAWETNPDNVYGALVAILILVCMVLSFAIIMLWRSKEAQAEKMMELARDATKGFQDILGALSAIKENEVRESTSIMDAIKTVKQDVIEHLKFLQEQIKNRPS